MTTLYAGPWVGELGWELFGWQSYIRPLATRFDRVIVSTRPGHEALYRDFCQEFVPIDPPQKETSGHVLVGFDYDDAHKKYVLEKGDLWIGPMSFTKGVQDFVKYGVRSDANRFDLLLHARHTTKVNSSHRNWPIEAWRGLVERALAAGLRVASIGSRDAAVWLEGTEDLRGIPLSTLVDVMASSRVTMGPSSGPMHLASLCRCPHLVWTDDAFQEVIQATNRQRYERLWNPFRTKVRVIDAFGWQPPEEIVHRELLQLLNSL